MLRSKEHFSLFARVSWGILGKVAGKGKPGYLKTTDRFRVAAIRNSQWLRK
jgi:hypothetical protein